MQPALFNVSNIHIIIDSILLKQYYMLLQNETLKFDGFLCLNRQIKNNADKMVNPKKNDKIIIDELKAEEEYLKPKSRYDEVSLINRLKKLGIGRPATYASFIDKIQEKKYVEIKNTDGVQKESKTLKINLVNNYIDSAIKNIILGQSKKKFVPTELSKSIYDYLQQNFSLIMNYELTAIIENKLDKIVSGDVDWVDTLLSYYKIIEPLATQQKTILGAKKKDDNILLGVQPGSKHEIYLTTTKYGHAIKIMDPVKPIFISIKSKDINLEEAIEIINNKNSNSNQTLGAHKEKPVVLCEGKYGSWLLHDNKKYSSSSFSKSDNKNITLDDAIKIITDSSTNKDVLWTGENELYKYIVRVGKFGNYIQKINKKNPGKNKLLKYPKDLEIKDITLDKLASIN